MKDLKVPEHVINGVNLGDYEFTPETITSVVKKYGDGKYFKWATLRCDKVDVEEHFWYEWAQYFKDRGIYFTIDNSQRSSKLVEMGKKSHLTKEIGEKIDEIAGEYFLGATCGEFGSPYASKAKGYKRGLSGAQLVPHGGIHPIQGFKNLIEARDTYVNAFRGQVNVNREMGIRSATNEAVTLLEYDLEAGIDFPIIELVPRNMEQILNFGRGAIRAFGKELYGAWLAHEWYGGYRMDDPLKAKRFTLEYLACYLGGVSFTCLESGYRAIKNHGFSYPEDHPMTQSYLNEAKKFSEFCENDKRPASGPVVKVAFVKGNLDGFGWGNSSSLWGQYYDEKWGFSAPEFSYRILDEVYRRNEWHNAKNFGEHDFSHAPAYGQYDVVPMCAPLDVLKKYDWLIFSGWNTMTPELYEKVKEYVANGGNVLIGACHMRDSIERDKKGEFVCREDFENFLGCEVTDEIIRANDGYKFEYNSTIDGIMYPGPPGFKCDPADSMGYTDYVKVVPKSAKPVCFLADAFRNNNPEFMYPIITENKYSKGNVVFMANSEYPGAPQVFPLYKIVVKEILTATHRQSDIKVLCNERVRFAVYQDEKKYKVYLVNTDYDFANKAIVTYKDKKFEVEVPSVGVETVEFEK